MATTNLTNLKANALTNVVSTILSTTNIVASGSAPKITSITYPGDDTAAATSGGQTITLAGTGFNSGASVIINGSYASVVTVVSSTSITFTSPANSGGTYPLYVVNTDGGTAISVPGISYSGTPSWSTAAGSIATLYETSALSNTVTATGDATISYSLYSGTLPPGSSLNTSTGLISGTSEGVGGSTTYTFTIRATDGQNQDTDRTFTITINPDAVTWSSPADNSTVNAYEYSAISPVTMSATSAAGKSITYTANTLPTGVSISGSTISGTPTVVANTNTLLTANAASTFKTATRNINFVVNQDVVTWSSPADGTTTSLNQNTPMTNVALSATSAAGQSVSYSANALPTGVTISGSNVTGTPTVLGNTTSVITATAANTNRTATRTFYWTVSVAVDTYFKNTTLLLNGETTVTPFINDASNNSTALTIAGDTKPVLFNPYTPGYYSNYFDGTGDYLSIAANSSFTLGTSDHTIEFWMYLAGSQSAYATQWKYSSGSTQQASNDYYFQASSASGATFNLLLGSGSASWAVNISNSASYTAALNKWTHVAFTRSGSTFRLFVNGTQVGSATYAGSITAQGGAMLIGQDGSGNYTTGMISNFRMVVGQALYTSTFTPSTTPLTAVSGTQLLTCQSNRFIDNSTNAFTVTKNGDTTISPVIPFTANSSYSTYGSAYFDGTGDYLSIAANSAFAFGTGDFTVEGWYYLNSGIARFTLYDSGSGGAGGQFAIFQDTASAFYVRMGTDITYASPPGTNQWVHFAVTRSGTTVRLFFNGTQVTSGTQSTNITDSTAYIGILNGYGNTYAMNGYISNIRVVKGTAVYTTTFTPPTTPLTAIANTSLLTLQYNGGATNQAIIDNSNFNNIITRAGNASQGTFSPYSVTGWSNYFSGSTSVYLSVGTATTSFPSTSASWTVEGWFYINAITASIGLSAVGDLFMLQIINTGTTLQVQYRNTPASPAWTINNSSFTFAIGTWYHIAAVLNAGSLRAYINGTAVGTASTGVGLGANGGTGANTLYIGGCDVYPFGSPDSALNGYVSNFRVTNTAVYTSAFTPSTTPLTSITGTQLLTCQSNRFVDNGPQNLATVLTGTPSVQAFSPFGSISEATPLSYSTYLNGSSYITVPSPSTDPLLGSGNYTVEFWTKTTDTSWEIFAPESGVGLALIISSSSLILQNQYGQAGILTVSASSILNDAWHHVAVVRNSGTITIYFDGTSVGTVANATDYSGQTQTYDIGYGNQSAGRYLTGYLSNFRVVNGTAVYTSSFTPSTTPLTAIANTKLLAFQNSTLTDNSASLRSLGVSGTQVIYKYNPFGYTAQSEASYTPSLHGGSVYFDGSGDYLSVAHTTNHWLTNQDFTIEAWFYCTRGAVGDQTIISKQWQGSSAAYASYNIYIEQTTGTIRFLASTSGGAWEIDSGSSTYTLKSNQWQHVAVTRSGSTFRLFINGVLDKTVTNAGSLYNHPDPLLIGAAGAQVSYAGGFQGYLSDVRIVRGVSLYNASFYPSLTALGASQTVGTTNYNSVLLVNGTNGGIVDQHGSVVLETVGNTQLNTSVKKYNNSSLYFDGTGDYLTMPSNQLMNFGTGDFTVEAWVYPNSLSSDWFIISASGTGGFFFGFSSTSTIGYGWGRAGTAWDYRVASTATAGTWQHVAVTRSGTSMRLFVNGTQVGVTQTISTAYDMSTTSTTVGSQGANYYLNGYVDDLRVTKGYARYTGNFTPPTALATK